MKISILTLFPEMFQGPFDFSIIKNAKEKGLIAIELVNIRDFGLGRHKVVDDTPYGGGKGMVMRVDVLYEAIQHTRDKSLSPAEEKVVLLDARGEVFKQATAVKYSTVKHLILLCGHYEGVDERIRQYIDETISIGDFILTGGEIPAMLVTDSVTRLISGVLTDEATALESFSNDEISGEQHLEYPQYTRPQEFHEHIVPQVLLSGNHAAIAAWRKNMAEEITKTYRPDLIKEKES